MLQESLLEHFNLSEHSVRILDRTLADKKTRGRIVDVYFKPEKVLCEHCESTNCRHIKFALSLPEVQKILQKKGWKITRMKTSGISGEIHRKLSVR